jgi:hypothetical protein
MEKYDLVGAISAHAILFFCILVFATRLAGRPNVGYWIGALLFFTAIPLVYLLTAAPHFNRPVLYYVQIGLMLCYLLIELLLDYVLKIDFRREKWMVISYVTVFFAGTGGMIGLAGHAGRPWSVSAIVLFLIMAALAFLQRARTGM